MFCEKQNNFSVSSARDNVKRGKKCIHATCVVQILRQTESSYRSRTIVNHRRLNKNDTVAAAVAATVAACTDRGAIAA